MWRFPGSLAGDMLRAMVDEVPGEPNLTCTICGAPLGDNSDDQPDWPSGPMCGECYQARQMDDEIWMSELYPEQDPEQS